jgi:hypothetical protein
MFGGVAVDTLKHAATKLNVGGDWLISTGQNRKIPAALRLSGETVSYESFLSNTATLFTFCPNASVPVVVTVRVLPSADRTLR